MAWIAADALGRIGIRLSALAQDRLTYTVDEPWTGTASEQFRKPSQAAVVLSTVDRASRSLTQSAVSPGRPAGADSAGYGWRCCKIVVSLSPLLPTANSGPPVRPDRLPPLQMKPPEVLKSAGS